MRILHAPTDVGNQPWGVSAAERALGHDSRVVVYEQHFGFGSDYNLHFERLSRPARLFAATKFFAWALPRFDIFHFYFATTFFPAFVDLPVLKALGKKLFFTFQGCDIRPAEACHTAVHHPDEHRHAPLAVQQRNLRTIRRFARKTYVLNPDLLDPSPTSEFLPYASVDARSLTPTYPAVKTNEEFVVIHAPSDRLVKGTAYLEAAVMKLQRRGYRVRLDLAAGIPHDKVLARAARADIAVDQLLIGWYGAFAVETMALGKPTLCYLKPEWVKRVPFHDTLPIVNVNHETIETTLANLLDHPERLAKLGRNSRDFAAREHDPNAIAKRLLHDYAS